MATMEIVYQEDVENNRRDLCFSCDWLRCDECGEFITDKVEI